MKLAAIDIGSNAIRFQITKVLEHDDTICFKKLEYVRFPLRLGQDVFKNNEISAEKEAKFIKLIQAFKNLFELYEVDDYIVCATSAMRESKNGKDIVFKVKYLLGIDIEIIDGEKEAELINKVLFNELNDKSYLHVDVGGGSTEINLFENKKKIASRSFKIGSVRRLGGMDKPEEWEEMKKWIKKNCAGMNRPIIAVGTGGNISKIYELANAKPQGGIQIISLKKIEEIQRTVLKHNYEDRVNKLMLNPDRADVIVPASEIYIAAMKYAGCTKIIIPEIGLKDGLMLMLYEKNKNIGEKSILTINKHAK